MNRTTLTSASLRTSAIAAAVALLALQAQAAPSAADLQQVKAYGNVTVAQDSAGSWGPWTEFEAPAAGPSQPLGVGRTGGEPYRPLPGTVGAETPTLVGWGLFFDNAAEPKQQGCVALDCYPLQLNIQANYPSAGALLPDTVNAQLIPLGSVAPLFTQTGELKLDPASPYYSRETVTELIYAVPDPQTANPGNPQEMQAAFVRLSLNAYLGGGEEGSEGTLASQSVYAVVGVATPAADMASLRARNAVATYSGRDQYGNGGNNIKLAVNFGNSTWTGVWNGGQDGVVQATTSPTGRTVLAGQVGFTTGGTISGSNFTANTFATGNGSINAAASSVNGSFFGKDAAAAGGVVNVVKTSPSYPGGGTYTGTFLTVKDK